MRADKPVAMVAVLSVAAAMSLAVVGARAASPPEGATSPFAPRRLGASRHRLQDVDCDIKAMQTQLDRIDDACCYLPDGNPLDCTTGPPV